MSKDGRPSPPSEADTDQAGSDSTATTVPVQPLEATAIAAHPPAQGARSSAAGADGAAEPAAGTPFGFWATAGSGLLVALASLLGGFVFLAALRGAGAPVRGFALAGIMAGIPGLTAVVGACALRKGTAVPERTFLGLSKGRVGARRIRLKCRHGGC